MSDARRYCTFSLGAAEYALDVSAIQEVLRDCAHTPVPLAPPGVLGLLNLRGQLVTLIELASRLDAGPAAGAERKPACAAQLVLSGPRPPLSLAVDDVGEVIELCAEDLQAAPATLGEGARRQVRGVHWSGGRLITVLETGALLESLLAEESR
jgi:purine-binding chemotaxis protein CheW